MRALDMSNTTNPPQQAMRDNRANQLNPAHPAYHRSRGASAEHAEQLAAAQREANAAREASPEGSPDNGS